MIGQPSSASRPDADDRAATISSSAARPIGVVLAGGRSRRMGTDKARLRLHGRSLLERQLALLHACGVVDCVVSGDYAGYRCVSDLSPDLGPLGALQSLVRALPDRQLLIIAVDTPALTSAWLRPLLDVAPERRCVHFRDHPLPLRLQADPVCSAAIAGCLQSDDAGARSLRALLHRLDAVTLPTPDGADAALASVNTPAEWQALLRQSAVRDDADAGV